MQTLWYTHGFLLSMKVREGGFSTVKVSAWAYMSIHLYISRDTISRPYIYNFCMVCSFCCFVLCFCFCFRNCVSAKQVKAVWHKQIGLAVFICFSLM